MHINVGSKRMEKLWGVLCKGAQCLVMGLKFKTNLDIKFKNFHCCIFAFGI